MIELKFRLLHLSIGNTAATTAGMIEMNIFCFRPILSEVWFEIESFISFVTAAISITQNV